MSNNRFNKNSILLIIGILLVVFGLWRLSEQVLGVYYAQIWYFINLTISIVWPIIMIGGGILLMVAARKGKLDLAKDRRLFRSSKSRKLGGVCGGMAEYLSVDSAMVRVIAIVLTIMCWYIVIPLYILFWIVIPYDTKDHSTWV